MLIFSIILIILAVTYAIFASKSSNELLQKAVHRRNEESKRISINVYNGGIVNIEVERDIEVLKRYGVNLMDDTQLSEVQSSDNPPYQISVFAPEPLELHSEPVYQSTLEWTKKQLGKDNTDAPMSKMIFWCRSSEQSPKMAQIINRIFNDLGNNERVFEIFECVKAPDHLFFIDMTMHFYQTQPVKVYVNPRVEGKTNFLVELSNNHATEVARMFSKWYDESKPKVFKIEVAKQGIKTLFHRNINCREVNHKVTESKETIAIVEDMFPMQHLHHN